MYKFCNAFNWLFVFGLAAYSASSWANGPQVGPCQLQVTQNEAKWAFDVEYMYEMPKWSAEKSAAELLTLQAQYFSGKSSPFMHNSIPSELAFYDPHAEFKILPFVTYTQTIDGRYCAQVVGAKLVIKHAPEILLARELAIRNCVSNSALKHQFKHDQVAVAQLKAIAKAKEEAKKLIFPTYEKQGAAGRTTEEIARQLASMEKTAVAELGARFQNDLRILRRQNVETQRNFADLYSSCQGEFEKASALAQPPVPGGAKE
jgi:uncharacterized protein (DUF2147 family)